MIRPHRLTFIAAASLAAVLLVASFGCAPKTAPGLTMDSPRAAWQAFRLHSCTPADEPGLLLKASLYYTRMKPTKRTNRTLVSMWGDFGGPMRLDISAGIGKLLAHIREDENGLLVFYPTEGVAYAHSNSVLGATRLGMPFPFSLAELGRVSMGDFSGLTPEGYIGSRQNDKGFTFELHGSRASTITLDILGRPILLEGKTVKAYDSARTWRLEIDRYEETTGKTPLPARLILSMDNGEKGVLRIKSREFKVTQWPTTATDLELPEDVIYHRLDNGFKPIEKKDLPAAHEDTP